MQSMQLLLRGKGLTTFSLRMVRPGGPDSVAEISEDAGLHVLKQENRLHRPFRHRSDCCQPGEWPDCNSLLY